MTFYAYGLYDELVKRNGDKQVILLRGAVWKCAYDSLVYEDGLFTNKPTYKSFIIEDEMKELNDYYFNLKIDPLKTKGLTAYLEYMTGTPQENLGIPDRFFTETRVAAWLSAIERGFDVMDKVISVHHCNSRLFLSLIHRFSTKLSSTKGHEALITKMACPELDSFPYNAEKDKPIDRKGIEKIKYMFDRFVRITKAYGFGSAIKYTYLSYKNK